MVDVAATTVYKLYRHFVWVVAAEQKHLNDDLVVGGPGVEVEADEIAFRCFQRDDGALRSTYGSVGLAWLPVVLLECISLSFPTASSPAMAKEVVAL